MCETLFAQVLDTSLFAWPATVVRQRSNVFDRFDGEPGRLQGGNRTFATATWPLDPNVDFLDAELRGFVGTLLGSALTCEGRALTATLETTRTRGGPTERVTLGVGDRHGRVVEGRFDVSDARSYVTTNLTTL